MTFRDNLTHLLFLLLALPGGSMILPAPLHILIGKIFYFIIKCRQDFLVSPSQSLPIGVERGKHGDRFCQDVVVEVFYCPVSHGGQFPITPIAVVAPPAMAGFSDISMNILKIWPGVAVSDPSVAPSTYWQFPAASLT